MVAKTGAHDEKSSNRLTSVGFLTCTSAKDQTYSGKTLSAKEATENVERDIKLSI